MDVAALGIKVTTDGLVQAERGLHGLSNAGGKAEAAITSLTRAAKYFAGVAVAAFGAASFSEAAKAAKNIENYSRAIGISRKALEEWRFSAEGVGISADNLSDILKDVSDKVGDFAETRGGR